MPNSCTKLPGNNSKLEPTTSESKNAKPQETQKWRNPKARRRDSPPASRKNALPPKRKKGTQLNKKTKKRRRRRGRGNKVSGEQSGCESNYFTLYHNNVRGSHSKAKSLEAITKNVLKEVIPDSNDDMPSVLTLNEINVR